jgi:Kdo2-lipid IVA lauroyltransferase/acyltransferase
MSNRNAYRFISSNSRFTDSSKIVPSVRNFNEIVLECDKNPLSFNFGFAIIRRTMWRYLKDCSYAWTAGLVSHSIARLPRKVALAAGATLGSLAFRCASRERELACRHLALSLDIQDAREIERLARQCFQNLGKNIVEFMQFPRMSPKRIHQIVAFEGKEHIDAALATGHGAIILTGHFGNWELLAASIVANGYTLRPLARKLRSERLDALLNNYREKAGYVSIDRDRAIRGALSCLKRNELLGILADVDTQLDGVFVDFFGRPAHTLYSPVAIALKTGAAVLPTFIIRQSDDSHRAVVNPPLILQQTGDRQQDLVVNTQKFTKIIESYVQIYPLQWIWMHERWKTQP